MPPTTSAAIEGQLNTAERALLADAVRRAPRKPRAVIEVGTWLGGGSTVHLLRALEANGEGCLWGVEADQGIYERMIANLRAAAPEAMHRFTPLLGFSHIVLPRLLTEQGPGFQVDLAFLDGGNNPAEQVAEFRLLAPRMPVGAELFAHDAKLRKGKWLVPYVSLLDNWECRVHDVSDEGLFHARKLAPEPSEASLRRAKRRLWRLRLEPQEIAATLLPRAVCGFVLNCLPRRVAGWLADGRA